MKSIVFEGKTLEIYDELRIINPKMHENLRRILKEMRRGGPTQGLGKPEPLKHHLSGLWSRRLSMQDRLIYRFDAERIYIYSILGHYTEVH